MYQNELRTYFFLFCLSLLNTTQICFVHTVFKIFWKKSGKRAPTLLLAPGVRNPCYATDLYLVVRVRAFVKDMYQQRLYICKCKAVRESASSLSNAHLHGPKY